MRVETDRKGSTDRQTDRKTREYRHPERKGSTGRQKREYRHQKETGVQTDRKISTDI